MNCEYLNVLLFLCGIAHIVLSIASSIIPKALEWDKSLSALPVLMKQMFWTYAAYILFINFSFGLLSVIGTEELLNHTFLAKCITLFIAVYWFARVLIQFFYFDTSEAPKGFVYKLGEIALVFLFVLFTGVYFTAFLYNSAWIQ